MKLLLVLYINIKSQPYPKGVIRNETETEI